MNNSDPSKVYSMSLYNKTKYYDQVIKNQNMTRQNVAKRIQEAEDVLKVVMEVKNEDLTSPPGEKELPVFKDVEGGVKISVGISQQMKMCQKEEVEALKDVLARANCPQDI